LGCVLTNAVAQNVIQDNEKKYYIKNINFNIKGRTRPSALLREGNFKTGEEFKNKEELDNYIAEKTRILLNNRVLSSVDIIITEEPENDKIGVNLLIDISDTRNFVILPEPKYSSNKGFEPSIKLRDYNFLGTMMPLKIDFGYTLDEFHIDDASKGKYSLILETYYPFWAFGFSWNFNFNFELSYVANENLLFNNITGLSFDIPIKTTTLSFGLEQGTVINEEYYLFEKQNHNEIFEDIQYMYSAVFSKWNIPLGIKNKTLGDLVYTPNLAIKFNYSLGGAELDYRNNPVVSFKQKIGFEKINWLNNFRDGFNLNIENTDEYNFYFNEWNTGMALTAVAHKRLAKNAGVSSRLRYKQWFNKTENYRDESREEAGDVLRGILDRSLYANYILSLNLDFPFHVFTFMPSSWLKNSKLKYFNFEFFISPIVDMAFANGILRDFNGKKIKDLNGFDFLISGGGEIIVFPLTWRSIFLRLSIGWNIKEAIAERHLPSGINREIFIGIGYQY
jgi:hypothetical protein